MYWLFAAHKFIYGNKKYNKTKNRFNGLNCILYFALVAAGNILWLPPEFALRRAQGKCLKFEQMGAAKDRKSCNDPRGTTKSIDN